MYTKIIENTFILKLHFIRLLLKLAIGDVARAETSRYASAPAHASYQNIQHHEINICKFDGCNQECDNVVCWFCRKYVCSMHRNLFTANARPTGIMGDYSGASRFAVAV